MSRHWVLVESVLKKRFHDFISSSVLTFEPMLKKRCYHFMSSKEQILPTRFPTRCRPMPSKAPQGAPAALSQHHFWRFHSTIGAFSAPFLALSQQHFSGAFTAPCLRALSQHHFLGTLSQQYSFEGPFHMKYSC